MDERMDQTGEKAPLIEVLTPEEQFLATLGFKVTPEMRAAVGKIAATPDTREEDSSLPDPAYTIIGEFDDLAQAVVDEANENKEERVHKQDKDPSLAYLLARAFMYRDGGRPIRYEEELYDALCAILDSRRRDIIENALNSNILDRELVYEILPELKNENDTSADDNIL
jgi:hypothetical protein